MRGQAVVYELFGVCDYHAGDVWVGILYSCEVLVADLHRLEPSSQSPIKPYLLKDPEDNYGVDLDFLSEAVKRFEEDDSVKPAFITAVEEMSRELSVLSISDDYKPYMTVRLFLPSKILSHLHRHCETSFGIPPLLQPSLSLLSLMLHEIPPRLKKKPFSGHGFACHLSRVALQCLTSRAQRQETKATL